jgi:hypothetical protein
MLDRKCSRNLKDWADRPSRRIQQPRYRAKRSESFSLAHVPQDTDLDPVRARTDFQELMMDLAFPANPFKE